MKRDSNTYRKVCPFHGQKVNVGRRGLFAIKALEVLVTTVAHNADANESNNDNTNNDCHHFLDIVNGTLPEEEKGDPTNQTANEDARKEATPEKRSSQHGNCVGLMQ